MLAEYSSNTMGRHGPQVVSSSPVEVRALFINFLAMKVSFPVMQRNLPQFHP